MALPKNPPSSVNRQPQGVPVGGQFAATAHSEPQVSLSTAKGHFSDADNDPGIENSLAADAHTGDDPTNEFMKAGGGSGGQPPRDGGHGGSGGGDDAEREANIQLMTDTLKRHANKLWAAETISISARPNNGTIRFDDVHDRNGQSLDDEDHSLASSLTSDVNFRRPGGTGIPAKQILGDRDDASLDAAALRRGEIVIVGPGHPQRY